MQVNFFGVRLHSTGEFPVRFRYAGQFVGSVYVLHLKFGVRLRDAGQFVGSIYALQLQLGLRLRYVGQFLGSVYAMWIWVRVRSRGELWGPCTLRRSIFEVCLRS